MKKGRVRPDNLSPVAWVLFLIWPFALMVVSVFNFGSKPYRVFIWLYLIFFGVLFVVKDTGSDAYSHALKFQSFYNKPFEELYVILGDFFNLRGEELDVYVPMVNFTVSRFTMDYSYIFAVHAAVFGFFYLKSISLIYDEFKGKVNGKAMLFLFMFIGLFSIHQINAVRFYTAMWMWIWGLLRLLKTKKLANVLICLGASLIHFGVTMASGMALLFFLLGRRDYIYVPLVFITFIAGNLYQLDVFVEFGSKVNEAAELRASTYTNLDIAAERWENIKDNAWFVLWRTNLLHYYLIGALALIYLGRERFNWDAHQKYVFSFLLLFLSFVNLVWNVPSLGGRMAFLFWQVCAYFLYRFFQLNYTKKISIIQLAGFFPILLWIAVEFRIFTDFANVYSVVGNPVFLFFEKNLVSLHDLIFRGSFTPLEY
jgi:hypothetical protein